MACAIFFVQRRGAIPFNGMLPSACLCRWLNLPSPSIHSSRLIFRTIAKPPLFRSTTGASGRGRRHPSGRRFAGRRYLIQHERNRPLPESLPAKASLAPSSKPSPPRGQGLCRHGQTDFRPGKPRPMSPCISPFLRNRLSAGTRWLARFAVFASQLRGQREIRAELFWRTYWGRAGGTSTGGPYALS